MPKFSEASLKKLQTCHPDLQVLFKTVIQYFDCIVAEGFRGKAGQDKAVASGASKLKWPNGKHNSNPSIAADVYPYDLSTKTPDWNDVSRCYYFSGFVMGVAKVLREQGKISHEIRCGSDWDRDTEVSDETFKDICHFELVTP